jgi:hypothetical protein
MTCGSGCRLHDPDVLVEFRLVATVDVGYAMHKSELLSQSEDVEDLQRHVLQLVARAEAGAMSA